MRHARWEYATVPMRNALAYNPETNRWQNLPSMPQARLGGAVVTLADGSVIVAGVMGPAAATRARAATVTSGGPKGAVVAEPALTAPRAGGSRLGRSAPRLASRGT